MNETVQQQGQDLSSDKKVGFRIDNYFINIPEGDGLITEDSDGNMFINVDIFKLDDHNYIKVKHDEVTEELEIKISAYINEYLMSAVEELKDKKKYEQDQSS